MSIIIKGVKMPQGNAECVEIYLYGDGTVFARQKITVNGRKINGVEAVEIQPHGRLIDADALLDELQKLFDRREKDARLSGNRGVFIGWNDAIFAIKTAPTIIEAEEAKE